MTAISLGHWLSYLPLGVIALLSWGIWIVRTTMSHRATPIVTDYSTTTSVVVPVYREDPEILALCLDTWIAAGPTEIILVVDTGDDDCLAMLEARHLPASVAIHPFVHTGKRSALGEGIRRATSEIAILVDSDTAWTSGLLATVQMPFADPWVGAVGTRQRVHALSNPGTVTGCLRCRQRPTSC